MDVEHCEILLACLKCTWLLDLAAYLKNGATRLFNSLRISSKQSPVQIPHCKNCFCKEPELLLLVKQEIIKRDSIEKNEKESSCLSSETTPWTLPPITFNSLQDTLSDSSDDTIVEKKEADKEELEELRLNVNIGMSLEPEVLTDPEFLQKRLAHIREEYEEKHNKLRGERESILSKQRLYADVLKVDFIKT